MILRTVFAFGWKAKGFASVLLVNLPALSGISGNSEQKIILQIIEQLTQFFRSIFFSEQVAANRDLLDLQTFVIETIPHVFDWEEKIDRCSLLNIYFIKLTKAASNWRKQPPKLFCKKSCLWKFRNIIKKTPVKVCCK